MSGSFASKVNPKLIQAALGAEEGSRRLPEAHSASLTLPWPPSVNHYWRHTNNGRHYISEEGRRYRERVSGAVLWQLKQTIHDDRLRVTITAHPPDHRQRDLDNLLKSLLDALQHGGLYVNDSQIDDLRIVRGEVRKPGCVEVAVERL
jgi:crossover junction endodeoxyribonuclease RusA